MNYSRNMQQVATYWPAQGNDGFGGQLFGSVQIVRCRWQDNAVLFRDATGQERTSSAIVYTEVSVGLRGYLCLGDLTNLTSPIGVDGAFEIRQIGKSPSLDGSTTLVKVYL